MAHSIDDVIKSVHIKYIKDEKGDFIIKKSPRINITIPTPIDFATDFGTGINLLGLEVTDQRWIVSALIHDLLRGLRSKRMIKVNGVELKCPALLGIALSFYFTPRKWQRWPMLVGLLAYELIRPLWILKNRYISKR